MEKIYSKLRRTDYYDFGHWDDFPVTQQWFATGECMAHLDHLRYSGNIDRRLCKTLIDILRIMTQQLCGSSFAFRSGEDRETSGQRAD